MDKANAVNTINILELKKKFISYPDENRRY